MFMFAEPRAPVLRKNHDGEKLLAYMAGLLELCSSRVDASAAFDGPQGEAYAKEVKIEPFYNPHCQVPKWLLPHDGKLGDPDDRVHAAAAARFCQKLQELESCGTGAMAILSRTHRWSPNNNIGITTRFDAVYCGIAAPILRLCRRRLESVLRAGSDLDNPDAQRGAIECLYKTLVVLDETRLRDLWLTESCATQAMCFRRELQLDDDAGTNDDTATLAKRVRFWFYGRISARASIRMETNRNFDVMVYERIGPFSRAVMAMIKHDPAFLLRMYALAPVDPVTPPKLRPWGEHTYRASADFGRNISPELFLAWRLVAWHKHVRDVKSSSDVCAAPNPLLDAVIARLKECSHLRHLFHTDHDDQTSAMLAVIVSLSALFVHVMSGGEQTYDLKRATGQRPQPQPQPQPQSQPQTTTEEQDDDEQAAIRRLAKLLAAVPEAAELVVSHTGKAALTIPGRIVNANAVLVVGTRKDNATTLKRKHEASSSADTGQSQRLKHHVVPDVVVRLARTQLDLVCSLQTPPSSTGGWRIVLRKYVVDTLAAEIRRLRAAASEIADAIDLVCYF